MMRSALAGLFAPENVYVNFLKPPKRKILCAVAATVATGAHARQAAVVDVDGCEIDVLIRVGDAEADNKLLPGSDRGTILVLREHHAMVDYSRFIVRDPAICGGTPVIKGTRVTLRTILASLADGVSVEEVLADFPSLTEDDVRAVIAFAAVSAEEDIPIQPIPVVT